jgi:threonyl-tRNA synthetase
MHSDHGNPRDRCPEPGDERPAAPGPGGADALGPDHRSLGRALGLFATDPQVGAGLPLWLPEGAVVRAELERLAAEVWARDGCQRVYTPVLAKRALFERSGHWAKFADDMFAPMEVGGEEFVLRPANCPHHALVFASRQRSYRELPVRLAELGGMFRAELSGVLTGLSRVRQINLDDTHVFCRPDQAVAEVARGLESIRWCYGLLGVDVAYFRLSLRGPGGDRARFLGDDALWDRSERVLAEALAGLGLEYVEAPGEAAFYGPKVDVQIRDAAGREETLSTVQLDLNQPERFDLSYVGADGGRHRPVMIHRGVMSAMERLVAHLVELYDGALPTWMAPVQAAVLPVSERHQAPSRSLHECLLGAGLRAELGPADGTLGARVRDCIRRRINYLVVIGDAEADSGRLAVRLRDGRRVSVEAAEFVEQLAREVRDRRRVAGEWLER